MHLWRNDTDESVVFVVISLPAERRPATRNGTGNEA
jgi:hypothetical protein